MEKDNENKLTLDNSGRSTYRLCKMKYFLQVINGWQPNYGSTALRYGSCWHGIQEGFHTWVKENGWPQDSTSEMTAITQGFALGNKTFIKESEGKEFYDDFKNFNTAVDHFNAYLEYFKDDKDFIEVIATEKKFSCPILPENSLEEKLLKKIAELIFTGKIDLCVKMDGMKWILDFKTTGWYLKKVIQQATRSPQLLGYSYAGDKVLGFKPEGCLFSFAYLGSTKSKVTGNYGKVRFDFRRIPHVFTAGDIEAWKLSFITTAIDIQRSKDENIWPESFDSCFQYGTCPYLRLCNQHRPYEDLNFEGFHVKHWSVLDE